MDKDEIEKVEKEIDEAWKTYEHMLEVESFKSLALTEVDITPVVQPQEVEKTEKGSN